MSEALLVVLIELVDRAAEPGAREADLANAGRQGLLDVPVVPRPDLRQLAEAYASAHAAHSSHRSEPSEGHAVAWIHAMMPAARGVRPDRTLASEWSWLLTDLRRRM
jgi:hypothetical protein